MLPWDPLCRLTATGDYPPSLRSPWRAAHETNLSHEKIARACQLSKGAVSKYVSLTQAKGIT